MIQKQDVSWGRYSNFEGPFFYGTKRLKLPKDHDFLDVAMYMVSQVEGNMDAVNMYDKCILTLGSIQFCDRYPQLSATKLIEEIINKHSKGLMLIYEYASDVLLKSGASIERNDKKQWRFCIDGKEVDSVEMQRQLFFLGSTGSIGSWTKEQRSHAKKWVVALVNILSDSEACQIQAQYSKSTLMDFVLPSAKKVLFTDTTNILEDDMTTALKCLYITYAINSPMWALKALKNTLSNSKYENMALGWKMHLMSNLVHIRGIKLHHHRYDRLRPELEKQYKIRLPNKAADLLDCESYLQNTFGVFCCAKDIQHALSVLGYDVGAIDGVIGKKTTSAVSEFKTKHGIEQSKYILDKEVLEAITNQFLDKEEPAENKMKKMARTPTLAKIKNFFRRFF